MRIPVYVSEVTVREGLSKATNQPYKMTTLTCFDLSPEPAMRCNHAINITLPKEQDALGDKLKDTKTEIDVYAWEASGGGKDRAPRVEAKGIVVVKSATPGQAAAKPI